MGTSLRRKRTRGWRKSRSLSSGPDHGRGSSGYTMEAGSWPATGSCGDYQGSSLGTAELLRELIQLGEQGEAMVT